MHMYLSNRDDVTVKEPTRVSIHCVAVAVKGKSVSAGGIIRKDDAYRFHTRTYQLPSEGMEGKSPLVM